MDTVHGANTINEDELDDLRTGYAEWIETCVVANMSGITSPMIHHQHEPDNDIRCAHADDTPCRCSLRSFLQSSSCTSSCACDESHQPADTVCMIKANSPCPAMDDCLSCVRENVAKDVGEDAAKNPNEDVVIEIQGGSSSNARSASEKGGDKNNGKRLRKVTSDHSVKNDREHGSGNIRRVYSLSEVLND